MGIKSESLKNRMCIRAISVFHLILLIALFCIYWWLFRYGSLQGNGNRIGVRYDWYAVILYVVLLVFFNNTYNSYLFGYTRIRGLVFEQYVSQFFSTCIVYAIATLAWGHCKNPICFLQMLLICFALDVVCSYCGNAIYYRLNPQKAAIIVYRKNVDLHRIHNLQGKPMDRLYRFDKELCCNGKSFDEIEKELDAYEAIFVAGIDSTVRNGILKYCSETGKLGFFLPHIGDVLMKGSEHIPSFSAPVLATARKKQVIEYVFIKRAFDIFASLCGIIVLSPIMGITAILIKAYDRGPALYKQTRLTKDGREFTILKFRSMRVDAEKDGKARLSSGENDDRITPIGRFVRKCRLDELPQLFNIFKGDMSIVGPRPERPEIAEQYYKEIPSFKLRLQVKAGLTGYAQVYGKYNTEPYEKLEFDLLYINSMSVLTDLKLMFATFGILFSHESTEGIAAGQTTAMGDEKSTDSTENEAEMVGK